MRLFVKLFFQLLLILSFMSCEESGIFGIDEGAVIPTDFTENFGEVVTRDFIGRILDKSNSPVGGVTVTIGEENSLTDSNGVFILKEASVYERFAYVKASKDGYDTTSATLIPTEGINKVNIVMLNSTTVETINSGTESTVSLPNGTSITFSGNFINRDSVAYSGTLSVKLAHFDPSDESFSRKIPGMLYAENSSGKERIVNSFGSLAVELKASNGTLLYLAKDSPAEIRIPVVSQLQGIAPFTIPMWYFEKVNGYWIEEGEATLQANKYVGNVSRLSYWHTGTSNGAVNLSVKVTNELDSLLANQKFTVSVSNSTYPFDTKSYYTNSNGTFNTLVPTNSGIAFKAYNRLACGNTVIHNSTEASATADHDVNIVIASDSNKITESLSGFIKSCDGSPIANGYVFLNMAEEQYFDLLIEGTYEINMLHCEVEKAFSIQSFDYKNVQESGEINYYFTNPITYLGEIPACSSIQEFIQFSIDGGNEKELITYKLESFFIPYNVAYNAPSLAIYEDRIDSKFRLFGLLNTNDYEGVYTNYVIGDPTNRGLNIGQVLDVSDTNNNITYNLVKLGDLGEFIDLHFSGDYEDSSGNPHSIVGLIHVIRDN